MTGGLEHSSDVELVERARKGDETAFEEIVRRHSPRVFKFAGRFLRQHAQIEEAAQEVFLRAYTQLHRYEARGSFEGWLTRITANVCLNMLRTAKRRPEMLVADMSDDEIDWMESRLAAAVASPPTAEDGLVAADLAEKVLSTMSPDDRLALTLVDGEEYSVKEVVEATGWSESKVKTQTFRARRRLREALERLLEYRAKYSTKT